MSLAVTIQMDPIESINPPTDTSLLLGLEAQRRGHKVYYYQPKHLSMEGERITARGHAVTLRADPKDYFTLGPLETLDLRGMDVVLLRQDPPFDMAYITTTFILEKLMPGVLVANHPAEVRNGPEKLLPLLFPEFCPPTLISSEIEALRVFRREHKDIILKPLYGHGGHGVFHLPEQDRNFNAFLEFYFEHHKEPLIAQRFLPEVADGDRRIIMIDGKVGGVMGRTPAADEIRANFRVGGSGARVELSKRQKEACEAMGPMLKERGLTLAGIDMIGDYLTEINVTSPTGLPGMNRLYGLKLEAQVWDALEARL